MADEANNNLEKVLELSVSEAAINKLKSTLSAQPADKMIRIFYNLSSRSFGLSLDIYRQRDIKLELSGVKFIVDPYFHEFVTGSVIDYEENKDGSGFRITNSKIETHGGCGCGNCGSSADNCGSCSGGSCG